MSENPVWPRCGHPRTIANTHVRQCRTCYNEYMARYQQRRRDARTPTERYEDHRRRYLAIQLPATEHKLVMLRNEAARLGLTDLLPGGQA